MKGSIARKMEDEFYVFGILLSVLVRWLVSLYPYSGAGKFSMYGDYEAQRHWMEITYNLPVAEWYQNTTDNDLMYWGLDYPPLTAFHSWINGYISHQINPAWVALKTSRGHESYEHKLFMRYTVLLCDLLIYIPAVVAFWNAVHPKLQSRDKAVALTTMLLYPGLYLIDHGHFQYNCVSIGFTLWAIVAIQCRRELVASLFFCLALNYKQMELYHAFPIFFYMLGQAWHGKENSIGKVFKLGIIVIFTFGICWLPFYPNFSQILHRLFPFARGIFEDKVANFWCSIHIFIKFRNFVSVSNLAALSGILTLMSTIPSSLHLLAHPNFETLKISLVNISLSFFLFSFHVHEKSILLVAIMFPLLLKDGLVIPFFTLFVLYLVGCYNAYVSQSIQTSLSSKKWYSRLLPVTAVLSILGALVLCISSLVIKPPERYPDLYPLHLVKIIMEAYYVIQIWLFQHYDYSNRGPAKK
ncbi:Dolichyl pyrophosphate Man9GlcNAc2 alpha-1,3-glucosyltransferase [Nymphon striatum]|nr:Dolichyl pyrophosphate Man9GlcNAc2 alpha-1,3-glucosyltransferase [Nymphon striatum]